MFSDPIFASTSRRADARHFTAVLALGAAALLAGCGSNYRPVVSSVNPVGPAAQPQKFAVAISANGATANGLVTLVDFAGDTILNTTALGRNPRYLMLEASGGEGYTLNGDGTVNSFAVSPALRVADVLQTTLPANVTPISILAQGANLYIASTTAGGTGSVAQLQGLPPAIKQQLPTGSAIYTVGIANAPRVYAIVPGAAGANGTVSAIDTATNTVTSSIPVGANPVYGVMTSDSRRAFILNNGSNTVSVVNAQTNALDTFTVGGVVTGTIPVGVKPIWADFAPTRSELIVANAGDGLTPGSLSVINIPFCAGTALANNPNCDPANPVDAVGFGTVLAANIPVGVNPVMVAVLQDGTRAYVANAGNPAAGIAGSISVVNLTNNTVSATIPAAVSSNAADATVHGHPSFIAVTTGNPTGKVYVTSSDSTDLTVIRTDTDTVLTHLSLQGLGVQVRVSQP